MKCPDQVQLSRADGEAIRTRLAGDALTADDRRVLDHVLQWYFWLLFALQEATFSLKRLRVLLFGESSHSRQTSPSPEVSSHAGVDATQSLEAGRPSSAAKRRPGHGRRGADTYCGAEHVECRHETLAAGERCPVCGRGRLYRVAPGVDIRLDGHALLSAVRYVLEKFRCSACGQVFTAAAPSEVGVDKYSPRARAVLVLGR